KAEVQRGEMSRPRPGLCDCCGEVYIAVKSWQTYCSPRCRIRTPSREARSGVGLPQTTRRGGAPLYGLGHIRLGSINPRMTRDSGAEIRIALRREILERLSEHVSHLGDSDEEFAVFKCPSGAIGDVVVEVDSDEVTVHIIGMTHGHFDEESPDEIATSVVGFL